MTVGVFRGQKTRKTMRAARVIVLPEKADKPVEIEALEVEAICNEHISIPDKEVIKKMEETGLDTRALSLDGDNGNPVAILATCDW